MSVVKIIDLNDVPLLRLINTVRILDSINNAVMYHNIHICDDSIKLAVYLSESVVTHDYEQTVKNTLLLSENGTNVDHFNLNYYYNHDNDREYKYIGYISYPHCAYKNVTYLRIYHDMGYILVGGCSYDLMCIVVNEALTNFTGIHVTDNKIPKHFTITIKFLTNLYEHVLAIFKQLVVN